MALPAEATLAALEHVLDEQGVPSVAHLSVDELMEQLQQQLLAQQPFQGVGVHPVFEHQFPHIPLFVVDVQHALFDAGADD